MGTINAAIRTRGISGDEYPIVIRVIHNRASAEVKVENFRIRENQWDETNQRVHPNRHRRAAVINSSIKTAMRSIEDAHDALVMAGRPFKVRDILELANPKNETPVATFTHYFETYIQTNPDELRYGTIKGYKSTLLKWKAVCPEVKIADITGEHLIEIRKYLLQSGKHTNTIYSQMKTIRKMIRRAMKQGLLDRNPFEHISLKQIKGNRAYLTKDELHTVIQYTSDNKISLLARDVFVFSCHTGLRFSDICRLSKDNLGPSGSTKRLTIRMGKTSEILSFNLSKLANSIVDQYMSEGEEFVFPMLRGKKSTRIIENIIGSQNSMLNAYLKEIIRECRITKNISMHCGRHSFAVNSLAMGGDIYVLSKLLGHNSLSTTELYAKAVDKRKDELTSLWNQNESSLG